MAGMTRTNTGSPRVPQIWGIALQRAELDLEPLRAFGAVADVPDGPNVRIEKGGFIVPRRAPPSTSTRGSKDRYYDATQQVSGLDEARPGSGSRKRAHRRLETSGSTGETHRAAGEAQPSTGDALPTIGEAGPTIATGSPPQTLGRQLSKLLRLEELEQWYPGAKIVRSSSGLALLSIDVGVIRSLPYRGRLLLEIPLDDPHGPTPLSTELTFVPTVRVWANWNDGIRPVGDHVYPDASICAYMKGEWIWGRDPLHVLVDWCTCWLAKSLHLSLLHRWPGQQHCPAAVAMRRHMLDEYCRCGEPKQYQECHYPEDRKRSAYELVLEEWTAASRYLCEVRRRGWATTPPWVR